MDLGVLVLNLVTAAVEVLVDTVGLRSSPGVRLGSQNLGSVGHF